MTKLNRIIEIIIAILKKHQMLSHNPSFTTIKKLNACACSLSYSAQMPQEQGSVEIMDSKELQTLCYYLYTIKKEKLREGINHAKMSLKGSRVQIDKENLDTKRKKQQRYMRKENGLLNSRKISDFRDLMEQQQKKSIIFEDSPFKKLNQFEFEKNVQKNRKKLNFLPQKDKTSNSQTFNLISNRSSRNQKNIDKNESPNHRKDAIEQTSLKSIKRGQKKKVTKSLFSPIAFQIVQSIDSNFPLLDNPSKRLSEQSYEIVRNLSSNKALKYMQLLHAKTTQSVDDSQSIQISEVISQGTVDRNHSVIIIRNPNKKLTSLLDHSHHYIQTPNLK